VENTAAGEIFGFVLGVHAARQRQLLAAAIGAGDVADGVVLNHGGDVEIFGTVDGVKDFSKRKTFVDARAVIRKSN
jgi:hypothetical protein